MNYNVFDTDFCFAFDSIYMLRQSGLLKGQKGCQIQGFVLVLISSLSLQLVL